MHISSTPPPDGEIVVPVYNEAGVVEASVRRLHAHLRRSCDFSFRITVADNASTDETLAIARRLSGELAEVEVLHCAAKGRGVALRAAWGRSDARALAYTDVDLSIDLAATADLVGPLLDGRGDLAIGSRLAVGARVTRGFRREVICRTYNILPVDRPTAPGGRESREAGRRASPDRRRAAPKRPAPRRTTVALSSRPPA